MKLLAQIPTSDMHPLFGDGITPPGASAGFTDPATALGKLVGFGIQLFVFGASLILLFYLLYGAFDWISSGGEKEKINKAQTKITNAVIGYIAIFVMLAVFGVITGDILGIVKKGPGGGWLFVLPQLK